MIFWLILLSPYKYYCIDLWHYYKKGGDNLYVYGYMGENVIVRLMVCGSKMI